MRSTTSVRRQKYNNLPTFPIIDDTNVTFMLKCKKMTEIFKTHLYCKA